MHALLPLAQQQAQVLGSKAVSAQTVHLTLPQHRRRVTPQALPSIRTKVLAPEFTAGLPATDAPPTFYPSTASASYASYDEEYRAMVLEQAVSLQHEADRLRYVMQKLQLCNNMQEKIDLLDQHNSLVRLQLDPGMQQLWQVVNKLSTQEQFVIKCLPVIGQTHVLMLIPPAAELAPALHRLASALCRVDTFYDSMGGLLGYQLKSLELILAGNAEAAAEQQEGHLHGSPHALMHGAANGRTNGVAAAGAAAARQNGNGKHAMANGQAAAAGHNGNGKHATLRGSPAAAAAGKGIASNGASSNGTAAAAAGGSAAAPAPGGGVAGQTAYHVPPGLDLCGSGGGQLGVKAAAQGLLAMPHMAEILPVGGAGDRLGLVCEETCQSLPAAMLPFMGRPMLEGLIRDCQAREYLYWHLTGTQVTTPIAIMTSEAKGNHRRITELMERKAWFGRQPNNFNLFRQPMVPVVSVDDGRWLLTAPLKVMMKPGGHGAIWKLMHDEGVFDWLSRRGRGSAVIRQISNPMAGVDTTLLALAGTGFSQRRAFGFMSCERVVGAAEGMNVLQERKVWRDDPHSPNGGHWEYDYAITNVEYTEFERLGISDQPVAEGSSHSAFPANTNILYVGLQAVRQAVEAAVAAGGSDVLPGLIFNLKKKVDYFDPLLGQQRKVHAGRMECTMQNLADSLVTTSSQPLINTSSSSSNDNAHSNGTSSSTSTAALADRLSTFMVYNSRNKVTSSAKKKLEPGSLRIAQTPEGAFYDLHRNGWEVLRRCGLTRLPEVAPVARYLEQGPSFLFIFHPALGPLWDVVAQKIRGGGLAAGSELVLEVAEARLVDVEVDGSLLVVAENVMGHMVPADQQQPQKPPAEWARNNTTTNPNPTTPLHHNSSSSSSKPSRSSSSWSPASDLYRCSSNAPQLRSAKVRRLAAAAAAANGRHQSTQLAAAADGTDGNSSSGSSSGGSGGSSSHPPPDALPAMPESSSRSGAPDQKLAYSNQCGRVHMMNVVVQNVGVDWQLSGGGAWKHQLQRHQACRIILHGRAEFEAFDCRISGNQVFEVPDGFRMVVTSGAAGGLTRHLVPLVGDTPTWEWRYSMGVDGQVGLEFVRHTPLEEVWSSVLQQTMGADGQEQVLDFTI